MINSTQKIEISNWKALILELHNHKYYKFALKVANHFLNTEFTNIKDEIKSHFYSILGYIHINLGNFELALEAFQNAYNHITPPLTRIDLKEESIKSILIMKMESFSFDFQKSICLMYIGLCNYYLHQEEKSLDAFSEVLTLIKSLNNKEEFPFNTDIKNHINFIKEELDEKKVEGFWKMSKSILTNVYMDTPEDITENMNVIRIKVKLTKENG